MNSKSQVSKIQPFQSQFGRPLASSGLWLCVLLPLSCCPGFFEVHAHCKPAPYILSILSIQVGLSSLNIIYELSSKKAQSDINSSARQLPKSWLLCLLSHHYLPVVVSCIAFFIYSKLDNPVLYICTLVCHFLQLKFTRWLLNHFGDSFSLGEAMVVGQAASLTLTLSAKELFTQSHIKTENQRIYAFIQIVILVSSFFGYLIWTLKKWLTWFRLCLLFVGLSFVGISVASTVLNEWPLWWFIHMISSPTRIALLGWWLNMSVMIVLTSLLTKAYIHIPQTVLRKTFHILMVSILLPGIILDPSLMYFASTAALILFVLLEVIRVVRIEPLSSTMNVMFSIFLDEKDSGSLVLSHTYLLGGLALPLWLYPCDFLRKERFQLSFNDEFEIVRIQFCLLPLLSGVLSIGIGDTAASIGGTYFGKCQLPGTRKTLEGSLFSAASQLTFLAFIVYFGSMNLKLAAWSKFIVAILIDTLVEAFTDQADNIVIPLILYTFLMSV